MKKQTASTQSVHIIALAFLATRAMAHFVRMVLAFYGDSGVMESVIVNIVRMKKVVRIINAQINSSNVV